MILRSPLKKKPQGFVQGIPRWWLRLLEENMANGTARWGAVGRGT